MRKTLLLGVWPLLCTCLCPGSLRAQDIDYLLPGIVKIIASPVLTQPKTGTGFIVRLDDDQAYIVTSAHVVTGGDPHPRIEFFTKQSATIAAEVLSIEATDPLRGLALLLVRGEGKVPGGLNALPLASTAQKSIGQDVLVIGFPSGAGPWNITKGNIGSRKGRDVFFQPPVGEGNSGGPIIQNEEVVGVVVGGSSPTIGQGVTAQTVQDYIEGLGVTPRVKRPLQLRPSTSASTAERQEIIGQDGAPMVLVPAGEFLMGHE
jgi:S1-C subfamily serine protease